MRTSKGFRSETRHKLKSEIRQKFVPERFLQRFKIGQNVIIEQFPLSQKGMPWPKFKGMRGEIIEKRGDAYMVKIKVGKKEKYILSKPEHLRAVR